MQLYYFAYICKADVAGLRAIAASTEARQRSIGNMQVIFCSPAYVTIPKLYTYHIYLIMKRLLPSLTLAALSLALPASADVASPTVRQGDFYCFRGMPASQINMLPPAPTPKQMRVQKLGNSKFDNTDGHDLREINVEGDYRVLVILVEFQDQRFQLTWGDPTETVDAMLNSDNYDFQKATGSAKDYFNRISNGQFNPTFEIHGPVTVSKKEIEYVTSDPNDNYIDPATGKTVTCYPASRMVEEAIKGLDDEIDFSQFDSDGDGYCDFVYLFFAGQGATTGGSIYTTVWPHAFTLESGIGQSIELDGVKINRYCTSSELGTDRKLSGIGTFCHEFSHVLGLPDLYDTANNTGVVSKCFTPGPFSCMDSGNYNNSEKTPPMYSAYEQYSMEWMKPAHLSGTGSYTLLPLEARQFAYQIQSVNNPQEYYILEARANSYLDQYMPGHGLLAWHIDFILDAWTANILNNVATHMRIDLVEADGSASDSTRDGDPFPGSTGICEFTKNISPAFKAWDGTDFGYDLRQIRYNFDGTVSFQATGQTEIDPAAVVGVPEPRIVSASANEAILEWEFVENANGYYVSVFDMDAFDGTPLEYSDFVEGYYFRKIDLSAAEDNSAKLRYMLSDLPSNKRLGVMVYAVNDLNASAMQLPIVFNTVDGNDFEAASTNIVLGDSPYGVIAEWDAVENADSYELAIVTRAPGEVTSEETFDFTGSRLPEGWVGTGKYDTRKFGVAAPSYALSAPGAALTSSLFDTPIRTLSFWACKRYDDEACDLHIYSLDADGTPTLAHHITDFEKTGSTFDLDMPADTYGVKFVYRYHVTDLYLYVDDIKLSFHDGHIDTPAAEAIVEYAETSAQIKGLDNDTEYIAYVTPVKADGSHGRRSAEVAFRVADLGQSGVSDIAADAAAVGFRTVGMSIIPTDENARFDVISADGAVIARGHRGALSVGSRGLYIVRCADRSVRVIL